MELKLGFLIRFQVIAGKEDELEQRMKAAAERVRQEPATITWFAFRFNQSEFGVIDTFYNEEGREAHWQVSSHALAHLHPFIVQDSMSINKIDIVAAMMQQ